MPETSLSLNEPVKALFAEQLNNWELARLNYQNLSLVQVRTFEFDHFRILVQFNPARIASSGAKVDAKTIAARTCFLCASNRPEAQKGIKWGNYEILVNPFPVFPQHFTIPLIEHQPQQIASTFGDMLLLAKAMDDFVVFYNGPRCGASAPDHMHFQAGSKGFLPLIEEYTSLSDTSGYLFFQEKDVYVYKYDNSGRTVFVMESGDMENTCAMFQKLLHYFSVTDRSEASDDEPMLNIICTFEADKWTVYLFHRRNFRPRQYDASPEAQLLISPATVELAGVFITPVEAHFNKIINTDIQDILDQLTFSGKHDVYVHPEIYLKF